MGNFMRDDTLLCVEIGGKEPDCDLRRVLTQWPDGKLPVDIEKTLLFRPVLKRSVFFDEVVIAAKRDGLESVRGFR